MRFKFLECETFIDHETIVMALQYYKKFQPGLKDKLLLSKLRLCDRWFQSFYISVGQFTASLHFIQPWRRKGNAAVVVAGEL